MDVRSSRAEMFLSDGVDIRRPASRLLLGGDDRAPGALDDAHDLGPLGRRDCEFVERLRHVVHERAPLARRDAKMPVRALHVLAGVFLRTAGGPAQHLSVTRYLKPAGGTLWCASSTSGLALSRGSAITRSMRSSTTVAMLYTPPSRS